MSYEIKKLLPRHYKIMDLLLLGKKQKEIARILDLSEQAVSSIVNSPVFKLEIPNREFEVKNTSIDGEDTPAELLRRATIDSARRLCMLLDSEDERVVLHTAKDILDRGGYPKVTKTTNVNDSTVVIDDRTARRIEQTLLEMGELL